MPRTSASALAVAKPEKIEVVERPRAPHDLSDEEVEIWVAVVNSMPADWFSPANLPMLNQYCRHAIQARRVAEWLEKATGDAGLTVGDYDKLLAMQDRESKAISSLAGRMRISQQAVINQRGNKHQSPWRKPWQ